jgi:glyoxylase-like metal-dependent hydrolase (beta-lactamase superfamily II)
MILEARARPPFYKNGFLVACERTGEAVMIDPGDEVDELLAAANGHAVRVRHILLTHAHFDHISGVEAAKQALSAPIHLHKDDLSLYERAVQQAARFGITIQPPPPVDVHYDSSPVIFGDYEVLVHHTPGHCPGGVCLQVGKQGERGGHLFVGDTLFAGSIGRTDLPGGDYNVLMRSIVETLFPLGDAAIVHPGHGPDTTIARERASNPFVLEYLAMRRE